VEVPRRSALYRCRSFLVVLRYTIERLPACRQVRSWAPLITWIAGKRHNSQRCLRLDTALPSEPVPNGHRKYDESDGGDSADHEPRGLCLLRRDRRRLQPSRIRVLLEFLQLHFKIVHVLESPLRILLQTTVDHPLKFIGRLATQRRRLALDHRREGREFRVASNALRPVTISYSNDPKLKMSDRASTFLPAACSGDM